MTHPGHLVILDWTNESSYSEKYYQLEDKESNIDSASLTNFSSAPVIFSSLRKIIQKEKKNFIDHFQRNRWENINCKTKNRPLIQHHSKFFFSSNNILKSAQNNTKWKKVIFIYHFKRNRRTFFYSTRKSHRIKKERKRLVIITVYTLTSKKMIFVIKKDVKPQNGWLAAIIRL